MATLLSTGFEAAAAREAQTVMPQGRRLTKMVSLMTVHLQTNVILVTATIFLIRRVVFRHAIHNCRDI